MSVGGYVLDNGHQAAVDHHTALAQLFNAQTIHIIQGLSDLTGRQVLEVGAGHGSMTHWLADEVGPDGQVVAVDIAPHVEPHPRIQVVQHDLTRPGPWPTAIGAGFDLVYTRMTVHHLPNRGQVLGQLVDRLAPGGWLLVQDLTGLDRGMVVAAPDPGSAELYEHYQQAKNSIFDAGGTDRGWAAGVHQRLVTHGLRLVETTIHSSYWSAGGPGLLLEQAVLEQVAPRLAERGMSDAEVDAVRQLLRHPGLVVRGHPLYSSYGQAQVPLR